jgi:hypothetical protein
MFFFAALYLPLDGGRMFEGEGRRKMNRRECT